MTKLPIAVLAAVPLFIGIGSAANAACTTNTTVTPQMVQDGVVDYLANPLQDRSDIVVPGDTNCDADIAAGVADANAHADAGDAALDAKLSAQLDDAMKDSGALAAALSQPAWLSDSEKFAIAGGVGFTDGSTAVGGTAIVRFNKNVSGYAGGAVNTNDTNMWAGKAGARVAW